MFLRGSTVAAALALATAASAAPGVQLKHFAGRVIVVPESRRDVVVAVSGGDPRLPPTRTSVQGATIVIDGGLGGRIMSCGQVNLNVWAILHHEPGEPPPRQRVMIRGVGPLTLDRLPTITVRAPLRLSISAEGAVFGEVGPSEALVLIDAGCGDWRLGHVRGELDVSISGPGDVGADRAGALKASLAGAGGLVIGVSPGRRRFRNLDRATCASGGSPVR